MKKQRKTSTMNKKNKSIMRSSIIKKSSTRDEFYTTESTAI